MKLTIATTILLAQSALCDTIRQAREAKVTAAAVLDRRADSAECNAGKTACDDGNGCCPQGSQCTTSKGVGMCADSCVGATLYCDFGNGVSLCCQPGASCDYSQSVCTQHKTDQGGVWTLPPTTTTDSTPYSQLPTAPVFTSTSGQDDASPSSSSSSAEDTQSGQSSSDASSSPAAGGSTTSGGATPTPTRKPNSASALVMSWSAGVLAVVFGVMAAL